MTAVDLPLPVVVTRHQCPYCRITRSKRSAAVAHMARCWNNPANRTCRSCVHFEPAVSYGDCEPGRRCSCGDEPANCGVEVELPDYDQMPVTDCQQWETR
ncbi:hypothetical protein [Streptomyces sp. NPDC002994]|uniref:hypothetical protein n=1 Tax=Streptomyces sp. NPDC002994 TaxID=3154441 RepID=UPI0033A4B93C